ncbi:MAG: hypothetical protein WC341_17885 [Bacteroidales bacterium]
MGILPSTCPVELSYVGIDNGGGAVNVGNRVATGVVMNWAAIVGSIVTVVIGSGDGGLSIIASSPGLRSIC